MYIFCTLHIVHYNYSIENWVWLGLVLWWLLLMHGAALPLLFIGVGHLLGCISPSRGVLMRPQHHFCPVVEAIPPPAIPQF